MSRILKRSIMIAGHGTSVSLEPEFWEGLKELARDRRIAIGDDHRADLGMFLLDEERRLLAANEAFSGLTGVNAAILAGLAVLVFVPIRYAYPSRMRTLRGPTMVVGTMWGVLFAWMLWRLPAVDGPWTIVSLIFPAYYVALSLWLQSGGRTGKV